MIHIHTIVEDGDYHPALTSRFPPSLAHINVFSLLAFIPGMVQMPLLGRYCGNDFTAILGDKVGSREDDFIHFSPLVRQFQNFIARMLTVRVVDDHLVRNEGVDSADSKAVPLKNGLTRALWCSGPESYNRLAVNQPQQPCC